MKSFSEVENRGEADLLVGGKIRKSALRVEAYGTVDELNSAVGLAKEYVKDQWIVRLLLRIQEKLFILGADLAAIGGKGIPRITREDVLWVDGVLDEVLSELKPRSRFIYPGGTKASAHLHLCRTICRRVERRIQALSRREEVNKYACVFSNRLSSLLFGLSLLVNQRRGVEEVEWVYEEGGGK